MFEVLVKCTGETIVDYVTLFKSLKLWFLFMIQILVLKVRVWMLGDLEFMYLTPSSGIKACVIVLYVLVA